MVRKNKQGSEWGTYRKRQSIFLNNRDAGEVHQNLGDQEYGHTAIDISYWHVVDVGDQA